MLIKRTLFGAVQELPVTSVPAPVLERAGAREVEAAHLCDPLDIDTRADLEALAAAANT